MKDIEKITLTDGNHEKYIQNLPKLEILTKFINDVALQHIEDITGLKFISDGTGGGGYHSQPSECWQIVALFVTYDFKTTYYNDIDTHNTLYLKFNRCEI